MRIATHNVQSGGFDNYRDYDSTDPPRLEAIQEAVSELDADFVGLTDTFRWHELYSPADLRAMFEYDSAAAIPIADATMARAGGAIGLTVLSRRELINPTAVCLGERQAMQASVELDDGAILALFTAYLHHGDESKRVAQATALAEHAQTATGQLEQTIVLGDFNTVSRSDGLSQLLGSVLRHAGASARQGIVGELTGVLEGRAYEQLIAAGFQDPNTKKQPTWPTHRYKLLGKVALPPLLRVDHILGSPDIIFTDFTVARGASSHAASDHFAAAATIAA